MRYDNLRFTRLSLGETTRRPGIGNNVMRWIVSVPVWGKAYLDVFASLAAPALRAAAARLNVQPHFLIHTDEVGVGVVHEALEGLDVEVRRIPHNSTYVTLQESHADAVASAEPGDRVVLLNADLIVSGNFFTRCAEHFSHDKDAVVLLGIRTALRKDVRPPIGAEPRALLEWAWEHRHQIIRDLEYPNGCSMLPTNLFFTEGDNTLARGFHLHPAAIVKHASTTFKSTIDNDLLDHYSLARVHVVTDPDDCALIELSPPERRFPVRPRQLLTPQMVAGSMRGRVSNTHCWLFEHRICVRGNIRNVNADITPAETIITYLQSRWDPRAAPRRGTQRGRVPAGRKGVPQR